MGDLVNVAGPLEATRLPPTASCPHTTSLATVDAPNHCHLGGWPRARTRRGGDWWELNWIGGVVNQSGRGRL